MGGKHMPALGKRTVLQIAVRKQDQKGTGGKTPTHNWRMGWAEWRNAVFLFVNAEGGKRNFNNTFSKGGRQISWFVGGANPTIDSPVVRRLLHRDMMTKKEGAKVACSSPATVLLFVRKHADEPFVNCGRLAHRSHDSKTIGFKFTWDLQDFQALNKGSEAFQRILVVEPPRTGRDRMLGRWA